MQHPYHHPVAAPPMGGAMSPFMGGGNDIFSQMNQMMNGMMANMHSQMVRRNI